ncbi:MAG: hypothetical protein AAF438_13695 [Pseudomonadota bacterium]
MLKSRSRVLTQQVSKNQKTKGMRTQAKAWQQLLQCTTDSEKSNPQPDEQAEIIELTLVPR